MFPPSTPPTGPLSKNHRKERLPGPAVGSLHHPERGLPAANKLEAKMVEDENERNHKTHRRRNTFYLQIFPQPLRFRPHY